MCAPGGLVGGNIELYVDNSNGDLTADELARIQDAVTAADAVTEPYGVAVFGPGCVRVGPSLTIPPRMDRL